MMPPIIQVDFDHQLDTSAFFEEVVHECSPSEVYENAAAWARERHAAGVSTHAKLYCGNFRFVGWWTPFFGGVSLLAGRA